MKPNFFVVGAAKAGTTALFEHLGAHPEVFICEPKEPHYYAFQNEKVAFQGPGDDVTINRFSITNPKEYVNLFNRSGSKKAIGEGSVSYLYYPNVAARIQKEVPDARIVCILRNPIDRAFSAYSFLRARLFEKNVDFGEALEAEPQRIADNWHHMWHYRKMGCYAEQLDSYLSVFPKEQIHITLFDDFRKNPLSTMQDIYRFLEIADDVPLSSDPSPHPSGSPRIKFLSQLVTRHHPLKSLVKPFIPTRFRATWKRHVSIIAIEKTSMSPAVRASLSEWFKPWNQRLEELIQRDLSHWSAQVRMDK